MKKAVLALSLLSSVSYAKIPYYIVNEQTAPIEAWKLNANFNHLDSEVLEARKNADEALVAAIEQLAVNEEVRKEIEALKGEKKVSSENMKFYDSFGREVVGWDVSIDASEEASPKIMWDGHDVTDQVTLDAPHNTFYSSLSKAVPTLKYNPDSSSSDFSGDDIQLVVFKDSISDFIESTGTAAGVHESEKAGMIRVDNNPMKVKGHRLRGMTGNGLHYPDRYYLVYPVSAIKEVPAAPSEYKYPLTIQ